MSAPISGSRSSSRRPVVLLFAQDREYRMSVAEHLTASGYDVVLRTFPPESNTPPAEELPDAIVSDVQATGAFPLLPGYESVPGVILTTSPSDATLRNLRVRASEVLIKPVDLNDLGKVVARAIASGPKSTTLRASLSRRLTARSPAMRRVFEQVERLRDSDCSVLILGETGTGKTVLARAIHAIGARGPAPFVDLNCAGLTTELMESELFGHERGAFTGAHASKPGLFDTANGGSLFLDEIGDIDLRVQPRILKVLEEKRFRRIGDVRERSVDVRLLAATNVNLLASVAAKTFRADLYYRISTIRLVVPPLRERREDILPLVVEILEGMNLSSVALTAGAEERLLEYSWPGNVRELRNVIESSTLLRAGLDLTADDLRFDEEVPSSRAIVPEPPSSVREMPPESASTLLGSEATDATSAEIQREHIRLALAAENGRVEAAARRLGIPRSTLYAKMKRYGLVRAG